MLNPMSGMTHCREDEGHQGLKAATGWWSMVLTLVAFRFA